MTRRSFCRRGAGHPIRRAFFAACLLATAVAGSERPAGAYQLYKTGSCSPGQKWDASRPITVRLLADSVLDWMDGRVQPGTLADLARMVEDIEAVVGLYNNVRGSKLRLEFAKDDPIVGDSNLNMPEDESFGDQTIVIGFTDEVAASSATAEAFAKGDPQDNCTRTRAHVMFRKTFTDNNGAVRTYNWIFGPPDTTDVNGRSFWTAEQPFVSGASAPLSFYGILTHEMGHALGLGHPNENYAIMAQSFRTWFRGPDHVLRTRLLPDDSAGLRALYGDGSDSGVVDISVTNSWMKSGDLRASCSDEEAAIAELEDEIDEVGAALDLLPPHKQVLVQANLDRLAGEVADAEDMLQACLDTGAAAQTDNCRVSSRGDEWVDREDGLVSCGVNASAGSAYPPVSNRICPGSYMQLRYTLNNHSLTRDVLAKAEVWLSPTTRLDVRDPAVLKSPDLREFSVSATDSSTIGQMFRMPADARDGQVYQVFVRVLPQDPASGADLWTQDADKWNNAIMLRSGVTASLAACT